MTTERQIDIGNDKTYKKLKKAYQEAVDAEAKIFACNGNLFLVPYGKYLLEYADTVRVRSKLKTFNPVTKKWKSNQ